MKKKISLSPLEPYKLFNELSYALRIRETIRTRMMAKPKEFGDLSENGLPHLKNSSWSWALSTTSLANVDALIKVIRNDTVGYTHKIRQSARRKRACMELSMKNGGKIYVYSKGECFDAPFTQGRYKGYTIKEECPEEGRIINLKRTHKQKKRK